MSQSRRFPPTSDDRRPTRRANRLRLDRPLVARIVWTLVSLALAAVLSGFDPRDPHFWGVLVYALGQELRDVFLKPRSGGASPRPQGDETT